MVVSLEQLWTFRPFQPSSLMLAHLVPPLSPHCCHQWALLAVLVFVANLPLHPIVLSLPLAIPLL